MQPTPPPVATKQQYLCQPLLDAVMANIRSPVFNHSLYRTFAPAMSAIHGPPIRSGPLTTGSHAGRSVTRLSVLSSPNVCGRKRKHEDEERQSVPNILQGEVARLGAKFLVNLDPSQCSNNGTVHLICKLGGWRLHVHPRTPGGSVTEAALSLQMTRTCPAFRRCSSAFLPTTPSRAPTGPTTETSMVRAAPSRGPSVVGGE